MLSRSAWRARAKSPFVEGFESPEPDVQTHRILILTVNNDLWTHPQALQKLEVGSSVEVTTSDGYLTVDGQRHAMVNGDWIRMEVGQRYTVVLIDDNEEGRHIFGALGETVRAVDPTGRLQLEDAPLDGEPTRPQRLSQTTLAASAGRSSQLVLTRSVERTPAGPGQRAANQNTCRLDAQAQGDG